MDSFTHPDEEYPHSRIERLADMLGELITGSGRRIAVAGLDALPHGIDQQIRQNTDAEIVSGDGLILALRAIKSPAEIAVIRHAYRIAQAGMEAGLAAVARGITEREIAAEAEYAMRRMGSEGMGIDTIVGAGATHTGPILTRTTFREVGPGDHVLLTIAPRYEGYHGAIGRVATVGEVRREISAAVDTAIAAQDAVRAAMRPGVPGKELDRIARDMCRAADLEQYFAYSGIHSVGVVEFEPPIMTSWYGEPLAEDMVLSIDIPFFFAPWGGLRIEDGFLVGASGAEPLQTLSRGDQARGLTAYRGCTAGRPFASGGTWGQSAGRSGSSRGANRFSDGRRSVPDGEQFLVDGARILPAAALRGHAASGDRSAAMPRHEPFRSPRLVLSLGCRARLQPGDAHRLFPGSQGRPCVTPCSTTFPSCMTITVWRSAFTTFKSWLMKM